MQDDLYSQLAEKYHLTRSQVKWICFAVSYGMDRGEVEKRCEEAIKTYVEMTSERLESARGLEHKK